MVPHRRKVNLALPVDGSEDEQTVRQRQPSTIKTITHTAQKFGLNDEKIYF